MNPTQNTIKNIIFDLGNVLINFHPENHLRNKGLSGRELEFIHREIFLSREWVELDRGTMTRDEALKSIYKRNPGREKQLSENTDFKKMLTPIESNTKILKGLKAKGYNLYYLTNYHDDLFEYSFKKFNFFREFSGGIVSAHVKLIKPDPRIYNTLLDKYNLLASESLFIDDTEVNTSAAEKLGIKAIHLKEEESLEKRLSMAL